MITEVMRSKGRTEVVVEVAFDGSPSDRDLADAVGFDSSFFGFSVDRFALDPGRALVHLWTD